MNEWDIVLHGDQVIHTFKTRSVILDGHYLAVGDTMYKAVFIVGRSIHCYIEYSGVHMFAGDNKPDFPVHVIEEVDV